MQKLTVVKYGFHNKQANGTRLAKNIQVFPGRTTEKAQEIIVATPRCLGNQTGWHKNEMILDSAWIPLSAVHASAPGGLVVQEWAAKKMKPAFPLFQGAVAQGDIGSMDPDQVLSLRIEDGLRKLA